MQRMLRRNIEVDNNWAFDHVKVVREHAGQVNMMLDREGLNRTTWQKGRGSMRQAEKPAYARLCGYREKWPK